MEKQKNTEKQPKSKTKKVALAGTISFKDLGIEKSDRPVCKKGFATWVRVLMQNWRQGTVACKGRADVSLSGKKPWKQKGTGRARAGTAKSPIWRGGGVTFGPQKRVKTLKVSRGTKKRVLGDLLFGFLDNKKVTCLNWELKSDIPKTSEAYKILKDADLDSQKLVLFLNSNDLLTQASFANLKKVNILYFDQANAFDLTNGTRWLVLKKDFDAFKEMVLQWI